MLFHMPRHGAALFLSVDACGGVRSDACVRARLRALAQEISISSLMETANRGTNKMRGRGANPPSRRPVRMDDEADMK